MNIWERRAIARGQQERHIRQRIAGGVEAAACFVGALIWIVFIAHLLVVAALGFPSPYGDFVFQRKEGLL